MLALALLPALAQGLSAGARRQGPGAGVAAEKSSLPMMKVFGPDHRRQCAKDRTHDGPTIIGGDLVDSGTKYPFLAWLGDDDGTGLGQFCGGSLISDRVVLTAGHCLYDEDARNADLFVRFRLADFKEERGIGRKVINWKRHEKYTRSTLHYDVTVLLLNESVPGDLVPPVRLSDGTKPFEQSGDKRIAGWGSTDEACTQYDTSLRDATVPMGTYGSECQTPGSKTLGATDEFDYASQICAGMYKTGEMQYPGCGDSGGPLMAEDEGNWTQVGMVSWSYGIPYPDVFTRVSHYVGWIREASAKMEKQGSRVR